MNSMNSNTIAVLYHMIPKMAGVSQNQIPSYKTINHFRVIPKVDALLESLFIQLQSQCLKKTYR